MASSSCNTSSDLLLTSLLLLLVSYSGAGKTVSAKYIMRYFATADDKEATGKVAKTNEGMTEVEEQILGNDKDGSNYDEKASKLMLAFYL